MQWPWRRPDPARRLEVARRKPGRARVSTCPHERGCVHCLARDAGVSQATGYRYMHEGIHVLAAQSPDLHEVLDRCRREGMTHVILDGTLIETDRLAGVRGNGNGWWFSQKHNAFDGNVQFLPAPDGTPL